LLAFFCVSFFVQFRLQFRFEHTTIISKSSFFNAQRLYCTVQDAQSPQSGILQTSICWQAIATPLMESRQFQARLRFGSVVLIELTELSVHLNRGVLIRGTALAALTALAEGTGCRRAAFRSVQTG